VNIQYAISAMFIVIIGITNHSFSMDKYTAIGAAILPISGAIIGTYKYREYKHDLTQEVKKHRWPQPAINWIEKIKYDVGIQSPIEYVRFDNSGTQISGFCTTQDYIIAGDYETVGAINHLVQKRDTTNDEDVDLAGKSVLIKHEFGHIHSNDSWKKIKMSFIMPAAIQAGFSSANYCFTKIFASANLKTPINLYTRSAAAIIALWIKITIWEIGEKAYYRHLEKNADQFALEHATRQEIEAFIKIIRENEQEMLQNSDYKYIAHDPAEVKKTFFFGKDPHPFPADRIAMAEKYLKKTE